jgi:hypothetical protein
MRTKFLRIVSSVIWPQKSLITTIILCNNYKIKAGDELNLVVATTYNDATLIKAKLIPSILKIG